MQFKAKLRRIGNSQGIYIPKDVITGIEVGNYITLEVITKDGVISEKQGKVITDKPVITPGKKVITSGKDKVVITPKKTLGALKFNYEKGVYER